MKIIEVIFNLGSGGAERFVVDLSNKLVETNDVFLFTLLNDIDAKNTFYKNELSYKINYINFKISPGYSFKSLWIFYKTIRREKPDIVHFHISNIVLYFILPILFYRKTKYFQTQHIDLAKEKNSNKLFFLIKYFLYKYEFIKTCAISKYNQKTLETRYSLKSTKLIVNGRNKHELSINSNMVFQEISSYKKNCNAFVFTHIGRCDEQKNQELLINAFNIFNKENDAILIIIGAGFNSKKGELLRSISNSNTYFLGEKQNATDYLAYSNAFCLSSIYEGMPISLIESYSCGCIPISTPVSGSIDYIIDGVTGFITEDFSIEGYHNTLKRFKENHYKINKETLCSLYRDNFSIKKCADNYMNWFLE